MTHRDIPIISVAGSIAIVLCFVLLIPIVVAFHRIDGEVEDIKAIAEQNRALVKQVSALAEQNHTIACATKVSTAETIAAQQKYLDDVRTGVRKRLPGISDNDIIVSIRRQQKFLRPYEKLTCRPPG